MPKVTLDILEKVFSFERRYKHGGGARSAPCCRYLLVSGRREISQEKAATRTGLNRRDFIEAFTREQVEFK